MECNISTELVLIAGWQCTECFRWKNCVLLFVLFFSFCVGLSTPLLSLSLYMSTFHMRFKTTQSINCSQLFWMYVLMCSSGFASVVPFKVPVHNTIRHSFTVEWKRKKKRMKKTVLKHIWTENTHTNTKQNQQSHCHSATFAETNAL